MCGMNFWMLKTNKNWLRCPYQRKKEKSATSGIFLDKCRRLLGSDGHRRLGVVIWDHREELYGAARMTMKGNWDVETSESCAPCSGLKIAKMATSRKCSAGHGLHYSGPSPHIWKAQGGSVDLFCQGLFDFGEFFYLC